MSNSASKWTSPLGDRPALTAEQESQNAADTHDWFYYWNEENQGWELFDTLA